MIVAMGRQVGSEPQRRRLSALSRESAAASSVNQPCVVETVHGNILQLGEAGGFLSPSVDAMIISHNNLFQWSSKKGLQPEVRDISPQVKKQLEGHAAAILQQCSDEA